MYQNLWNTVKLSWEHRNAVESAKLDGPFSCNRLHMLSEEKTKSILTMHNTWWHCSILWSAEIRILLQHHSNICLSETYLDFNTPLDHDNFEISGYTLVHSDHPPNTKCVSVCFYYKNNLPLRVIKSAI